MTKKELEQLIDLKEEIDELERNIAKIEQMDIKDTPIKVAASSQDFPYTQGRAIVQEYDPVLADKRDRLLCEKRVILSDRKHKAAEEEKRLMRFINNIEESRIRRIMQYRYVDGYSWEKIGGIMHFDRRTGERIISRYLKRKNESCPQCPL